MRGRREPPKQQKPRWGTAEEPPGAVEAIEARRGAEGDNMFFELRWGGGGGVDEISFFCWLTVGEGSNVKRHGAKPIGSAPSPSRAGRSISDVSITLSSSWSAAQVRQWLRRSSVV